MAELMFGLNQTKKKKSVEKKVKEDHDKQWNYQGKGMDGYEKFRKGQHDRDQHSKEVSRDQIQKNHDFDMAKSLFGPGGSDTTSEGTGGTGGDNSEE